MIEKIAVTPYNARESLGWLARNITGLSDKNDGIVQGLMSPHIFNDHVRSRYKFAAIGDILPMRESRLEMDSGLKDFLADSDYLIGNFEGTITRKRSPIWPIAFDQRHDAAIVEDLAALFPPERTHLSVSNNHAGDFGEEEFIKSVGILESRGFRLFGWDDRPYADTGEHLRIISGTMWSNREFAHLLPIDGSENYIKLDAFNMLYPHIGYELELYPRPGIVEYIEGMADAFDAVICHHPHCPQPVTSHKANGKCQHKLIAYSLGDFCCSLRLRTMRYGLIVKADVGQSADGRWLVGSAEWVYTECIEVSHGRFLVRPVSDGASRLFRNR
jgi:hypothetical protein